MSYLLGACKGIGEHAPAAILGVGSALVYPAAVLGTAAAEVATEYFRNKKHPDDLAEEYRECLLHAIKTCVQDTTKITPGDRAVVELWEEGLKVSVKGDPLWKSILEDSIPTRMLSVKLDDASSWWPILRAQLELWTNWFRYRRTATVVTLGFDIPRQPLQLSPEFDRYLAANLPRELLEHFQPELFSGHHRDAFNKVLLEALRDLGDDLRPLDPVLRIEEFQRPEDANTALKLLDAQYRAVPYVGRRADLDALWAWLRSPAPALFQVVVGRGGNGKTRFAFQFLEELREGDAFRWHAGLMDHARFQDELKNEKFRRWRGRMPTLIVIDYADAAAPMLEEFIVPEIARTRLDPDDRFRFLLLARTAGDDQGWYKTLRRAAGTREADLFPNPPLVLSGLDSSQRRELVQAVLSAAPGVEPGQRLSLPPPAVDATIDDRLASDEFVDPLVLCMAAVVAHTQQDLHALHLHRTDLAREIAKHERRRFKKLAKNGDAAFLDRMAACVTLVDGMSLDELKGRAEAESENMGSTWPVRHIAQILAPEGGNAKPIRPDIIGEWFVYDVLCEPADHGPEVVRRAAGLWPGSVSRTLVRTVQDYEPDPRYKSEEDKKCQSWALTQLTALLEERQQLITDDAFWQIHAALPENTVLMIEPARNFYRAICRLRDPRDEGAGLAALVSYAIFESKAGNRVEALAAIQRAVGILRELVGKNREAFLPDLAGSLNNQANRQSAMGQRAEALVSIQEAVQHYRELVGKNREAFLPDLALSHGAWGSVLLTAEEPNQAAQKFAEGVRLITPLARKLPQAHFELAVRLAHGYSIAAEAAGQQLDPECTWPLEVLRQLNEKPDDKAKDS